VVKDITESPIQALVVNAIGTDLFLGGLKTFKLLPEK
jgi:hypothetical protein